MNMCIIYCCGSLNIEFWWQQRNLQPVMGFDMILFWSSK
jgi:hypothetical protein